MATLRITQTTESTGQYRVEIALEGDGLPRQTATASFPFALTEQDQKDLRWYLEDYLQFPHEPAPKVAARVEQRIADIGTELFKAVFQSSEAARGLWSTLRTNLNDMRVEIITEVREAASIPWELIRDPRTDRPLALHAQAFGTQRAHQHKSGPISSARAGVCTGSPASSSEAQTGRHGRRHNSHLVGHLPSGCERRRAVSVRG